MSVRSSPSGFSLHDFFTRVLPGAILVGPLALSLYLFYPQILEFRNIVAIIFVISSFILGELVEQIRIGVFRVPIPFLHFIYQETGDISKMNYRFRKAKRLDSIAPDWFPNIIEEYPEENRLANRMGYDFRPPIEKKYQLNLEKSYPRDIYDCMLIDLEPEFTERTKRQKTLYEFFTNLKIASGVAIIFYLPALSSGSNNKFIITSIFALFALIIIIFIVSIFLQTSPHGTV